MSDRGHCSPVLFTCTSFLSHVSSAKSTFKASRFELSATCSISKRGLYSSCTPAPTHNFICAHGTKKKLYIIYSHTHTQALTPRLTFLSSTVPEISSHSTQTPSKTHKHKADHGEGTFWEHPSAKDQESNRKGPACIGSELKSGS